MFGLRKKAGSYLPIAIFAIMAWTAMQLGRTFGQALTIFAVLVWAVAGLLVVYMILFRNMKFTLGAEEETPLVGDAAFVDEAVGAPQVEVSEAPGSVEVISTKTSDQTS